MAYGTENGVAALCPMWTNSGSFDAKTSPTSDQVNNWINQLSALADLTLKNMGFETPVVESNTVSVLTLYIETAVADMCAYVNKAGRFYETQQLGTPKNPISIVTSELKNLVDNLATGLESSGAVRAQENTDGIGYRLYDEDGDYIAPMFQRKFANWHVRDVFRR